MSSILEVAYLWRALRFLGSFHGQHSSIQVIDITLCSPNIFREVSNWHVSLEDCMSDHQVLHFELFADHIPFTSSINRENFVETRSAQNRLATIQLPYVGPTTSLKSAKSRNYECRPLTDFRLIVGPAYGSRIDWLPSISCRSGLQAITSVLIPESSLQWSASTDQFKFGWWYSYIRMDRYISKRNPWGFK
jgi:hypothetical protein